MKLSQFITCFMIALASLITISAANAETHPLFELIRQANFSEVKILLDSSIQQGLHLDIEDQYGYSPLQRAISFYAQTTHLPEKKELGAIILYLLDNSEPLNVLTEVETVILFKNDFKFDSKYSICPSLQQFPEKLRSMKRKILDSQSQENFETLSDVLAADSKKLATCPICLEGIKSLIEICPKLGQTGGHGLCSKCVKEFESRGEQNCPVCRNKLASADSSQGVLSVLESRRLMFIVEVLNQYYRLKTTLRNIQQLHLNYTNYNEIVEAYGEAEALLNSPVIKGWIRYFLSRGLLHIY